MNYYRVCFLEEMADQHGEVDPGVVGQAADPSHHEGDQDSQGEEGII